MIKKILFQGDSITDAGRNRECQTGWGFDMGSGYAILIAGRLQKDHLDDDLICENRGISGNRVVDLYARWKIDALNLKPDLLSILIGVNDTWHEKSRENGVEVDRYEQIYRMLLQWTVEKLPEVKLVLCEPFCLRSEVVTEDWVGEIAARGEVVRKLAKEFNAVFVPLQQVLSEAAERAGDNLKILRDGVHPTLTGSQIIADQWLKTVNLI